MPSATMDYASRNGSHTNRDKDSRPNIINGAYTASENANQKGKADMEGSASQSNSSIPNQPNGSFIDNAAQHQVTGFEGVPADMDQQPPELTHITEGYLPLAQLLSRLAISSRNNIESVVMQLSEMPLPQSAVNGNGAHMSNGSDDNSRENVAKKLHLLAAAQKWHAQWLKALVITQWSRRAPEVSRLIDLTMHFKQHGWKYDAALAEMAEMKRSLGQAAVPNPDLRTALEVLTTGKSPWMPDLGYLEAPPLTPQELLKELTNLNTLLSIRLNFHEYDKIPYHFRDFTIKSGRVTFRVAGEFEVDLTIADEDPEAQFWFIDFRFLFSPAPSELTEHFRNRLEGTVNTALAHTGLDGCYNFLHEMTLTHKIAEFRRQAVLLNRGNWIGTLLVEPLHRGFSLQYWVDRYGKDGPKSWILVGVHSGKRKDGRVDSKAATHIGVRWFRDSKEVMDVEFEFDLVELSVEALLKAVIARHIGHYLLSIYDKLKVMDLFDKHDLELNLSMSRTEPADSQLRMQCTRKQTVTVSIEPVGGLFAISPASPLALHAEHALNTRSRDPAMNAHEFLIHLRCRFVGSDITSCGVSVGWEQTINPGISMDDLKTALPRDTNNLIWLRRTGFLEHWYLVIGIGASGEQYYLMETSAQKMSISGEPSSFKIQYKLRVPITSRMPVPTYKFMSFLHIITAALMTFHANRKAFHDKKIRHVMVDVSRHRPLTLKIPAIFVRLEDLLESAKKPWAQDAIKITFQGIETRKFRVLQPTESPQGQQEVPALSSMAVHKTTEKAILVIEARMKVNLPTGVALQERVDRDIAFNPRTKTIAIRLYTPAGTSIVPTLISRLQRVHRLVTFVGVMKRYEKSLKCDSISLSSLVFSYGTAAGSNISRNACIHEATVDFADGKAKLKFQKGNPHIRILDHLTHILAADGGLDIVAEILPRTLPLLQAFDAIEDTDSGITDDSVGDVHVHPRATDWYAVSYTLPKEPRKIILEVRQRQRAGVGWWHVKLLPPSAVHNKAASAANDANSPATKRVMEVFAKEGEGYLVLGSSAVTKVVGGNVTGLLEKLDRAVRGRTRAAPVAMMGSGSGGAGGAPVAVMFGGGSGKGNTGKGTGKGRVVVDLD